MPRTPAKKSTARKKTPAKRASTKVAKQNPLASRIAQHAGAGMETMTHEDLALPFIALLQALSPQCIRGQPEYMKTASPGMFYNTVTDDLYDGEEGLIVIPCYYEKAYNVWIDRDVGGGFRGSFRSRKEAEEALEANMSVVDTANHYVLAQRPTDNEWTQAVLSMTSTKLTPSRRWNSQLKQLKMTGSNGQRFTPPSFASIWRVVSRSSTNDKGTFFIPHVSQEGFVEDDELFDAAETFYQMFAEHGASLNYRYADREAGRSEAFDDDDEDDDF